MEPKLFVSAPAPASTFDVIHLLYPIEYELWLFIYIYTTLVWPRAGATTSLYRLRLRPKASVPCGSGSTTLPTNMAPWCQRRGISCFQQKFLETIYDTKNAYYVDILNSSQEERSTKVLLKQESIFWSENDILPLMQHVIFRLLSCPFCLMTSLFCISPPFTSHFLFFFPFLPFSFPFFLVLLHFPPFTLPIFIFICPNDIADISPHPHNLHHLEFFPVLCIFS